MKNTLIVISAIFVFLISYLLQANFFNWFNIAGITPNLFVILVLFLGLFGGKRLGIPGNYPEVRGIFRHAGGHGAAAGSTVTD